MNLLTKLRRRLALAVTITGRVDDSPGWHSMTHRPHDREWGEIQELYLDALTAWRKNPMAKRIVDLTTDHILSDFIITFRPHHQNMRDVADEFLSQPGVVLVSSKPPLHGI